MSETSLKQKTLTNMMWRFAERCGAQFVSFIVSLVLARILMPEDFGVIALISVFISILSVFVDSGFANALIQKKDADDIDFSTVFFFNLFICTLLYVSIFFAAPLIAKFYNNLDLIPLIRVLSITLIISGIKNVQQAYVSKKLIFKKFFFATIGGTIGAAIGGIYMALKGFGVWALVFQNLFNLTVDTIILWITVKWRPKFCFSLERLKSLFSYGWKLLVASLINTLYTQLNQLIIGKIYTPADLAHYNKANHFPELVSTNLISSIDSVLFPVMSERQNEIDLVRDMVRKSIQVTSYILWPMMIGLAATGKTLIPLLLTEKWNSCIPYLIIFCFVFGFEPIATANLNAIRALGRSDYILKMEACKKVGGLILLIIAMPFGVLAIALSRVVYCFYSQIINSFPNKKLLGYGYRQQLKDLLPSFLAALFMGIAVYFMNYLPLTRGFLLICQVIVGISVYLAVSVIFKLSGYKEVVKILRRK